MAYGYIEGIAYRLWQGRAKVDDGEQRAGSVTSISKEVPMKWQAANLHRFQEVCLMADPWKLTRLSSSKGIEISQKRAKAIQEARAPTTNKELNRLLGPFPSSGSRNSCWITSASNRKIME
ncbi:hypothetical protein A2U01_0022883 [Trifolium medium]|uniref:Uncharacterized protein n=1 Tax=Trifolium medium TaxID=97028 RepID=A0A392NR37_9FABA|nr:hypothetical protein [Trifolium medium]